MALYFSPCILSLCLPLLIHTVSHTIYLLMKYNYRCLLLLTKYPSYYTLYSHVQVMSKFGQLRTFLNLMATRQISCLSTQKSTKHLHNLPTSITMGYSQISFKHSVYNLGLMLDCHLTMNEHVFTIARTCYFELRRLASIRRFQTNTTTATLVYAFVMSRIDYCDSPLLGSTHGVTFHLQRIPNYAVRVILCIPISANIITHLKLLH